MTGENKPQPLGVTLRDDGANVAVYSAEAECVELCLFDETGHQTRVRLPDRTGDVHHGFVRGIVAGQRYGFRAQGPWRPEEGLRFNPAKLLLDPYARKIERPERVGSAHPAGAAGFDDLVLDLTDTAPFVPKSVVEVPIHSTSSSIVSPSSRIIYELNVRGFTKLHPGIPETLRGTFSGLAHPAVIAHLVRLGITTVELMPVAAWLDERHLPPLGLANSSGLANSWGYNPIAFMAPDPRLAPGGMAEVAACVAALHEAGLEVILDVVFNHTAESDERGQTFSLRGLDNRTYYRLADNPRFYINDTGCGHTIACDRPPVVGLIVDALRHWVLAAGVDGFRFDLATSLGRLREGFDPTAPLFAAIDNDPILRDRVMIAEPWDIGPGGYQLGNFSSRWLEWNDRYRDDVRRFWRGDGNRGSFATRLAGSSDLFDRHHRKPSASVNFIAAHDGFTLADVVSYAAKHNEANGENNRDGHDHEVSWNNGAEGPTEDPSILAARLRDVKSMLATLLLSHGTPMVAMGDELGRSQRGNNNAYAQDNETTWVDWNNAAENDLTNFVATLSHLRRSIPHLTSDAFLTKDDVTWLGPNGQALSDWQWNEASQRALGMWLQSDGTAPGALVWFNAGEASVSVTLPHASGGWRLVVSSTGDTLNVANLSDSFLLPRGVAVLQEQAPPRQRANGIDHQLLDQVAVAAGISREWYEVSGKRTVVSSDTKRALLDAMGFATGSRTQAQQSLEHLTNLKAGHSAPVEKHPCYLPKWLEKGERRFGIAAHLYTLRRDGDQGIGDFTTLRDFADNAAQKGAATLALNPLHALFPSNRNRASPYQPSDRRFLEPHYIDIAAVPEASGLLDPHEQRIAALNASRNINYPSVWQLKHEILQQAFYALQNYPARMAAFYQFRKAASQNLQRFARFQALEERLGQQAYLQGLDAAVDTHAFEFALYLQFLAEEQLAKAANTSLELGLYRDLAVGAAPDGAEVWSSPGVFMPGVTIGSPPDPFSAEGQIWALPPLDPWRLRETNFAHFRDLLRSNMRHAGALRIDHAMALQRLYVIPTGASAAQGAYISYPFEQMLGVLADESQTAKCLIVGEDLGTVPEGFRERLEEANVLSYRVLFFERDGQSFLPSTAYPQKAVACVATHDLPTLKGWWQGADIDLNRQLGRLVAEDAGSLRQGERKMLLETVAHTDHALSPQTNAAIHNHIARSNAALAIIQTEDLAGEADPVNVPGTDREHPNWQRRLPGNAADIVMTPDADAVFAVMRTAGREQKEPL